VGRSGWPVTVGEVLGIYQKRLILVCCQKLKSGLELELKLPWPLREGGFIYWPDKDHILTHQITSTCSSSYMHSHCFPINFFINPLTATSSSFECFFLLLERDIIVLTFYQKRRKESFLFGDQIHSNYLSEFKIIRTGNYERPFMRSTLSNKNSDMMLEPNGLCQVSRRKLISWSNLSISPTTRTSQLTFISYGVICKLSQLHRSILHFSLIFNAYVV
jgi:hypothetical protein